MRSQTGRGAEPGGALGKAAYCHRQAYLQHTHKEPPCHALRHLRTGRTARRGLAGEASPALGTPGRHRSAVAGDGVAWRGERPAARQPHCRGWPKQVTGVGLITQSWPSGVYQEQSSSWQEWWKPSHPALWPPQPAASRSGRGHQQAAQSPSARCGKAGTWQACSTSGAGSRSRPRHPRSPAGLFAHELEDRRARRPAKG
jgi:hypothetical protein